MLTGWEVDQFKLFGFVILRGLFSTEAAALRAEIDFALRDAFDEDYETDHRSSTSTPDGEVYAPGSFLPILANGAPVSGRLVADDGRLWDIAEQLIGDVTLASPALAACIVGETPWHRDGGLGVPWIRFNAYLDDTRRETGALLAVPGSQAAETTERVIDHLSRLDNTALRSPDLLPAVAIETEPGDVIAFDPRIFHASFGGDKRLRWSVDYLPLPDWTNTRQCELTRDLIVELSDWPAPPRWHAWRDWTAARPLSMARSRAIDQLSRLGVPMR